MAGSYKHIVRVSEAALTEMIMSGVTAYEARLRRVEKKRSVGSHEELYVETGAHLWGYSNPFGSATLHYVEHVSVSAFAKRKKDEIREHAEEVGIKRQVMRLLRPELRLLGDFHSHPYKNLRAVSAAEGWLPSPGDKQFWRDEEHLWLSSGQCPVNLILAICHDRKPPQRPEPISSNTFRFGLGEFRLWLTAIVGERRGNGLSLLRSTSVGLYPLPFECMTTSGDSIRDFDPV